MAVAYYKLVWNGATLIEQDPMNMIDTVDGIDRSAALRASIGKVACGPLRWEWACSQVSASADTT